MEGIDINKNLLSQASTYQCTVYTTQDNRIYDRSMNINDIVCKKLGENYSVTKIQPYSLICS